MARDKAEDCVVEFLRVRVGGAVSAVRELDEFGARDQSCELATEVGRGDDIVLGAEDERSQLQFRQVDGTIECENGVDPAGNDLRRRKRRKGGFLALFEQTDIPVYPPVRIEKDRG